MNKNKLFFCMDETFKKLEEIISTINRSDSFLIFSSRGSYPFMRYLSQKHQQGEYKHFRTLKHIYSIKELTHLIMEFPGVKREIYELIAKSLDEKLKEKNLNSKTLVDIDEVITGANLVERIKIYSSLKQPKMIELYSFVSGNGRNLKKDYINKVEKLIRKNDIKNEFIFIESDIEWSDNEEYYDLVNLHYPLIMKPSSTQVLNNIKKGDIPKFIIEYITQFCCEMSQYVENEKNIMFNIVRDTEDALKLNDKEKIRNAAVKAYFEALRKVKLKQQVWHLNEDKIRISEDGNILTKKGKPILEFADSYSNPYRNPFVLIYTPEPKYKGIPPCM